MTGLFSYQFEPIPFGRFGTETGDCLATPGCWPSLTKRHVKAPVAARATGSRRRL